MRDASDCRKMPYPTLLTKAKKAILDPHLESDQKQNLTTARWSPLACPRLPHLVDLTSAYANCKGKTVRTSAMKLCADCFIS